jgi:hypothetical protein
MDSLALWTMRIAMLRDSGSIAARADENVALSRPWPSLIGSNRGA